MDGKKKIRKEEERKHIVGRPPTRLAVAERNICGWHRTGLFGEPRRRPMFISGRLLTDMAMIMIAVMVIRHFCHVESNLIDLFLH